MSNYVIGRREGLPSNSKKIFNPFYWITSLQIDDDTFCIPHQKTVGNRFVYELLRIRSDFSQPQTLSSKLINHCTQYHFVLSDCFCVFRSTLLYRPKFAH